MRIGELHGSGSSTAETRAELNLRPPVCAGERDGPVSAYPMQLENWAVVNTPGPVGTLGAGVASMGSTNPSGLRRSRARWVLALQVDIKVAAAVEPGFVTRGRRTKKPSVLPERALARAAWRR